jgi:acyl dehydratase
VEQCVPVNAEPSATGEPLITDDMRQLIGQRFRPYSLEVEKGDMLRFAEAARMTSPAFTDEVTARHGRYGGLIASPTYVIVMRCLEAAAISPLLDRIPYGGVLDGGSSWTFLEPIRPGDRIEATARLTDLYERQGKLGRMLFAIIDIDYTNQLGECVVRQRDTSIWYR